MKIKPTLATGIQRAIGISMRLYRGSLFYPRLGRTLGKGLILITRCVGPETVIKEIRGVKFELDLREVIDASLFYSGSFEVNAERTIETMLSPGMVALDVGANFGYHTFRMAKAVGASGKVIAIEPTGWAFSKLQKNAALNKFTNIKYLKLGLSDRNQGPTPVHFQASYRLDGTDLVTNEIVSIFTLDTVFKENHIDSIDFVKMDVDGFEVKVIRGAVKTLAKYHPILFFEFTPSLIRANDDDPWELIRTLLKLKYTFQTDVGEPIADLKNYLAKGGTDYSTNLLAVPLLSLSHSR